MYYILKERRIIKRFAVTAEKYCLRGYDEGETGYIPDITAPFIRKVPLASHSFKYST